MLSLVRNALLKISTVVQNQNVLRQSSALYHALSKSSLITCNCLPNQILQPQLLAPIIPLLVPCCGFKVKGRLKRRCKDCYFVVRQQRLYVICKTHPRHKQMSMVPKEKNTWILTHATMGKIRPW